MFDDILIEENKLEFERMRLTACGVAAMSNTRETVKQRIGKDHVYYSASYGDVCDAVDREIMYREALESILNEIGIPQPGYPAPVSNAYDIACKALNRLK